mgnify:FL=1
MSNIERRGVASSERAIEEGEDKKIRGVASVFNSESRDLGGFTEVIDRHAFDDVLESNPDVTCLWNHNSDDLLGRTSSGTLRLWTEDDGLHYEVDPPNTTLGNDMRELLKRGDVNGSSFAFTVDDNDQTWEDRDDGSTLRTIKKVSGLFDCSLVTVGAYDEASVALRSLEQRKEIAKEAEVPANPCLAYKRAQATAKASLARADQLRKKSKQEG